MPLLRNYSIRHALLLVFTLTLAGCKKEGAAFYPEPKDPHEMVYEDDAEEPNLPRVTWKAPADWKALGPDQMSLERFQAGDASITVTPLGDVRGQEVVIVNMMRSQFKQDPLDEAAAQQLLKPITVGGRPGRMFDFTATRGEGEPPTRSVVVMIHRKGRSFFFKLQGSPETVEKQYSSFAEFLGSVKFETVNTPVAPPLAPPQPAPSLPPAGEAPPQGAVPAGWVSVPPGEMQDAKFTVPAKDGATAEVTVSIFAAEAGGIVANVRRWRGQLGLPEMDDAGIQASAKPLEGAPAGSVVVDLENGPRALIGAIVPRDGNWFYYKLFGGTPAVVSARESFIIFTRGQ